MRPCFLAPLCALLQAVASAAPAQAPAGPGARELIEFTHILQPESQNKDLLREQVSPDGRQAFIVTRKGDVASDRNRYEIQLLDIAPVRLAAQRVPSPVVIFSAALGLDNDYHAQALRDVRWQGDRTLVFLARLDDKTFQAYRLDVQTRELVQLTHETSSITGFAVSEDMHRVVYAVQVPNPPQRAGAHEVVVDNQSFWSVKFGQHDLRTQRRMYRFYVADTASSQPARPLGEAFKEGNTSPPAVDISPDGRWALLSRYEPERLAGWARQYPLIDAMMKDQSFSQQIDPRGYFSTPFEYVGRRMTAWRLDDAREQAVVDAPDDASPGGAQLRPIGLWQGTGTSVVIVGTHLPMAPDGKTPPASHVIEYWPDSRRWVDIAALAHRSGRALALGDGFFVLDGTKRREFHRRPGGGWLESSGDLAAPAPARSAWTLSVVQGANQPPDVFAAGPSGESRRLTVLNPQFDAGTWGTMRPYSWRDASGRHWDGGLMAGPGMDASVRRPLLIQTYGFAPDRFYLDGPNPSDGATSAFAGRAFLRDGILVLALPWRATDAVAKTEPAAIRAFNVGVRGAVDALVKEGRVDPAKVGIIGFSATGERVLNLVTFGDVPLRAATLADGDANTLFSYTITYGGYDPVWNRKEATNLGLPFGAGLAGWIRHDPALHTDCVHAALRMETYGPWVLNNWDIHALLRRQYKAAEMVVIPSGTHQLLIPGDRMASLQGNLDWFGFWLAGKARTTPLLAAETEQSLAAQYARWQEMATLKAADDARPRCVR